MRPELFFHFVRFPPQFAIVPPPASAAASLETSLAFMFPVFLADRCRRAIFRCLLNSLMSPSLYKESYVTPSIPASSRSPSAFSCLHTILMISRLAPGVDCRRYSQAYLLSSLKDKRPTLSPAFRRTQKESMRAPPARHVEAAVIRAGTVPCPELSSRTVEQTALTLSRPGCAKREWGKQPPRTAPWFQGYGMHRRAEYSQLSPQGSPFFDPVARRQPTAPRCLLGRAEPPLGGRAMSRNIATEFVHQPARLWRALPGRDAIPAAGAAL